MVRRRAALRESILAGVLLAVLASLFWKLRIIDTAQSWFSPSFMDMIVGQQPMTIYALESLKSGRLPLWNPHQLCGEPFLAIPYVGFFYLPNLVHLLAGTAVGFEISYLLHMIFAAVCMWLLAREIGLPLPAALASALTYIWSGWMVHYAGQPQLVAGLAWMPATVLAIEKILRGSRAARLGLVLAVAFQVLNGAMEILLHALYAGGLFAVCRLVQLAAGGAPRTAAARGATIACCVVAGVLVSAVQLLPTLELVLHSARGPGQLDLADSTRSGILPLSHLFASISGNRGGATAGVLSLVAFALALGSRRQRTVWIFCVTAAVLAALLAAGGPLYRAYFELPIGSLFRRPVKFLSIYAFAQALLCGLALARLGGLSTRTRRELWGAPDWWLCVSLAAVIAAALARAGRSNPYLLALLALLALFGALPGGGFRRAAIAAVVLLHGASLFTGTANRSYRPWHFPEFLERQAARIEVDRLRSVLGHERLYIWPKFHLIKQGLLADVAVVIDYEPLSPRRYADYFAIASASSSPRVPFTGKYRLDQGSRWSLMDLTGTRLYLYPGPEVRGADRIRIPEGSGFRRLEAKAARLVERTSPLPRAFFVARARRVGDDRAVLRALADEHFDPRREILLEGDPADGPEPAEAEALVPAEIDLYEPERVEVLVDAPEEGFLVLTDLHYPGWKVTVDGRKAPMLRANYLFRAVRVGPGRSRVRFSFEPASFRIGLGVTLSTAVFLIAVGLRRRRSEAMPTCPSARRPDPVSGA